MELIVVIALLGCLLAVALPATGAWMENIEYRQTATGLLSVLRDGRSRAITMNREHRVEIDRVQNRYRLLQGNRGIESNRWDIVAAGWISPPHPVSIAANISYIHLNVNGTSSGGTISVQDAGMRTRYNVRVSRTGRFRIISP